MIILLKTLGGIMTTYTEKQMRLKIKQFIAANFKNIKEYAKHYSFNDESCRQALRGDRPLTTSMIATVSDGKIPNVRKHTKITRFYEYED
jgi:hypothetical protein